MLRLRRERGWSQTELAKRAGLSRGAVANLEIGAVRSPDEDTVSALAAALETTAAALWTPAGEASAAPVPMSGAGGRVVSFADFLQRRGHDVTERERGLLEDLRNRPGSALTGTEQDWLALLDWVRRNYLPRG